MRARACNAITVAISREAEWAPRDEGRGGGCFGVDVDVDGGDRLLSSGGKGSGGKKKERFEESCPWKLLASMRTGCFRVVRLGAVDGL